MEEIKDGNKLIAKIIRENEWNDGLAFFSDDKDFIQVGTWVYQEGKDLLPHVHNTFERASNVTQEVIYVRKGAILARFFGEQGKPLQEIVCKEGDTVIALAGGHGYRILENDTKVLEVKNGPYFGPDRDRKRLG